MDAKKKTSGCRRGERADLAKALALARSKRNSLIDVCPRLRLLCSFLPCLSFIANSIATRPANLGQRPVALIAPCLPLTLHRRRPTSTVRVIPPMPHSHHLWVLFVFSVALAMVLASPGLSPHHEFFQKRAVDTGVRRVPTWGVHFDQCSF